MKGKGKYKLSFTAATALVTETITVARQQCIHNNWETTRKDVLDNNLLMKDRQATAQRQYSEIELRLKNLSSDQLCILANGSIVDVKAMIWISILCTYEFFNDLMVEVIRENHFYSGGDVSNADYYNFWESKKALHPEVEAISDSTAAKVKQVAFKILEQVGIIDSVKTKRIIKPILTTESELTITNSKPHLLAAFLYDDNSLNKYLNR